MNTNLIPVTQYASGAQLAVPFFRANGDKFMAVENERLTEIELNPNQPILVFADGRGDTTRIALRYNLTCASLINALQSGANIINGAYDYSGLSVRFIRNHDINALGLFRGDGRVLPTVSHFSDIDSPDSRWQDPIEWNAQKYETVLRDVRTRIRGFGLPDALTPKVMLDEIARLEATPYVGPEVPVSTDTIVPVGKPGVIVHAGPTDAQIEAAAKIFTDTIPGWTSANAGLVAISRTKIEEHLNIQDAIRQAMR